MSTRSRRRTICGWSAVALGALSIAVTFALLMFADRVLVVVGDGYFEPARSMPWIVPAAGGLMLLGHVILRGTGDAQAWLAGIRVGLVVWCALAVCAAASQVGLVVVLFGPVLWVGVAITCLTTTISFVMKNQERRAGRDVPPRRGQAAVAFLVIATATMLGSNALLVSDHTVTLSRAGSETTIVRTEGQFFTEMTTVYRTTAGSPFALRKSTTIVDK